MVVAALLIVGFALAAVVVFNNAGQRISVLAIGNAGVAKGQVVERSDLVSISQAGVAGAIPVEKVAAVVGKTAAVDLVPGQLLLAPMVTSDPVPGSGQSLVGLDLSAARVPATGLEPGDTVDVIAVPGGTDDGSGGAVSTSELDHPHVISGGAQVYGVQSSGAGGDVLVTVIVKAGDAARVAAYSTGNRLAVVETSSAATSSATSK